MSSKKLLFTHMFKGGHILVKGMDRIHVVFRQFDAGDKKSIDKEVNIGRLRYKAICILKS